MVEPYSLVSGATFTRVVPARLTVTKPFAPEGRAGGDVPQEGRRGDGDPERANHARDLFISLRTFSFVPPIIAPSRLRALVTLIRLTLPIPRRAILPDTNHQIQSLSLRTPPLLSPSVSRLWYRACCV